MLSYVRTTMDKNNMLEIREKLEDQRVTQIGNQHLERGSF